VAIVPNGGYMTRSACSRTAIRCLSLLLIVVLLLGPASTALAASGAPFTPKVLATIDTSGRSQQVQPRVTPQGLSAVDWASIQSQIAAGPYRAYIAEEGGYQSATPA